MEIMASSDLDWLKPSATAEASEKIKRLQKSGMDVADFTRGQPESPNFTLLKALEKGAIEALKKNKTGYTSVAGIPELREKIAEELSEELGVKYIAEEIAICQGGRAALYLALELVIDIDSRQD